MPVRQFGTEELELLKEVLDSGTLSVLSGGKMQGRFEHAFATAHGAKYGVAMNCAMSVLHAALITAGVKGPDDEVICDPVCVFGALATMYQRGTPVFVDCQPLTYNLDPALLEAKITARTKAVIVTHIGGLPAEMDRIMRIARRHRVMVIEDCAHSFRATYKGRYTGTWGDVGSFSFQMSKQLATGDGGMAITNNEKIAKALALHAGAPTFLSVAYGLHYNYRMNEQTAAIGLAQLPKIRKACRELIRIGDMWNRTIQGCPWLTAQQAPPGAQSTYHLWVATFSGDRHGITKERFVATLKKHQAPFSVGYTNRAAYQHPVFDDQFPKGTYPTGLCPNAEYMVPRMVLGYPMVSLEKARRAADALTRAIKELT